MVTGSKHNEVLVLLSTMNRSVLKMMATSVVLLHVSSCCPSSNQTTPKVHSMPLIQVATGHSLLMISRE